VKGKRIFEIGCGKGAFLFWAWNQGATFCLGVEPEAEGSTVGVTSVFDEVSRALDCGESVSLLKRRIQDVIGDGMEPFDVVLSYASINHIDETACSRLHFDPAARARYLDYFSGMASVLKPGGRLILVDCQRSNFFKALGLASPFAPGIAWRIHQNPGVWAKLISEAGFTPTRLDWIRYYPLRHLGRFFHNRLTAYFLHGVFLLEGVRGG